MKVHLNDSFIKEEATADSKKTTVYRDTELTGFGLQITNKGNKSFIITYRDVTGRQRQEKIGEPGKSTTTAARATAFARLQYIQSQKERAGMRAKSIKICPTLSDYFYAEFLPLVRSKIVTHETTAANFRNHIAPILGHLRLDQIGVAEIANFTEHLRQKVVWEGKFKKAANRKLAEKSIERILIHVRHVFNMVIESEQYPVYKNPARHIKVDNEKRLRGRTLSTSQLQALAQAAGRSKNKDLFNLVKVMAGTGLRRSNVLKMEWSWVDFESSTLTVPKTEDKVRKGFSISLAEPVLDLLKELFKARTQDAWVFLNPETGKPYACIRESWLVACKRAGLGNVRIHDLRHSFATIMLETGASLEDVRIALTHTNIATTTIYVHPSVARQAALANAAVSHMGVF